MYLGIKSGPIGYTKRERPCYRVQGVTASGHGDMYGTPLTPRSRRIPRALAQTETTDRPTAITRLIERFVSSDQFRGTFLTLSLTPTIGTPPSW